MPLVESDGSPFEWKVYKAFGPAELVEREILPQSEGFYSHETPSITALLISHAHQDHYGLLRFIHPDIPLYMSVGTKCLLEVSNLFLSTSLCLEQTNTFTMWSPFQVKEFTVTPYLKSAACGIKLRNLSTFICITTLFQSPFCDLRYAM